MALVLVDLFLLHFGTCEFLHLVLLVMAVGE
eukprot:SAG31_NODE_3373_length_4351_cov_2.070790_4_plen_31_part_00